jgi:subtilisin-like proprotein convertase family protein/PKD repeat protein
VTVKLRFGLLFVVVAALAAPGAAAADQVLVLDATTVTEVGLGDGVVAAGDQASIGESIRNVGSVAVTGVSATLTTSTAGVSVTQPTSTYPDIAAGASAAPATPFQVSLADSLPCGATLDFSLNVASSAGIVSLPFSLVTGVPGDYADYTGSATVIGDSMPTLRRTPLAGMSGLLYTGTAAVSTPGSVKDVQVVIGDLSDHDTSHLEIALVAPDGTQITLVDHRGAPGGAFSETRLARDAAAALGGATSPFTGSFRPDGDLGAFVGAAANGSWRLLVAADTGADIGRLSRWTLRVATADCTPRARLSVSPSQIAPGQSATLDASRSVSTALHGITLYQYDYDEGSGFETGTAVQSHPFTHQGPHTVTVRVYDAQGPIGTATTTLIVSQAPTAAFSPVGSDPVKEGTLRALTASASTDSDGTVVSYAWDTDDDGAFDDATGVQPFVWFPNPGTQTVGLRVTDNDGATTELRQNVTVVPTVAPTPALSATPNPVQTATPVLFDASASHDDGAITSYEWDLDGDGSFETQTGTAPHASRSYPNATVLSVRVRVTDDDLRTAVAGMALVVQAPTAAPVPEDQGVGAGDPFTGGGAGGSTGGGSAGPGGGQGGSGGGAGGGGGSAGAGAGEGLAASLAGSAIQPLKLVVKKGLGLRCSADRAVTCSVTASLLPRDARKLGLSKSRTKAYVLGHAAARLTKAGAVTLTVPVARRAASRLKRLPRVTVLVAGTAVDAGGGKVTLRRAVLLRR